MTSERAARGLATARGAALAQLPTHWSRLEVGVFLAISAGVLILAWRYSFSMDRLPVFDEIGLANAVYTYLTTGRMTYPMHGHAEMMVVHPPVHYWVTAELMKLARLQMFDASAAPIFLFTCLSILVLFTGRFSFAAAVAAVVAIFGAIFIWTSFYSLRPELHVSSAWACGLLLLQAAWNWRWSYARLFLGTLLVTYAGMVHYWAVVSFLAAGVYAAFFLWTAPRRQWLRGLGAIAAGGLVAGIPYLYFFVVPLYREIIAMTSAVQGDGDWRTAFARHLENYANFARHQDLDRWPQLVDPTRSDYTPRWLVETLLRPIFEWRVPALLVSVPLLLIWPRMRPLALAGAIVPAFVLLYSQGKNTAETGYYVPEMVLYLFTCLYVVLESLSLVMRRLSPGDRRVVPIAALAIGGLALAEVPASMGPAWAFRPEIDILELNRAAGRQIIGDGAVIGLTSAGNWYTAGGTIVWNAFNELHGAEQKGGDLRTLMAPADAFVIHVGNWWNAQAHAVPLTLWYAEGRLQLRAFILDEPAFADMNQLYVMPDRPAGQPVGFLVGRNRLERFVPTASGGSAVSFLVCGERPAAAPPNLDTYYAMPVATEPGKPGPHLVMFAGSRDAAAAAEAALGSSCRLRDRFVGQFTSIDRDQFFWCFLAEDRPMRFAMRREEAVAAKTRGAVEAPIAPYAAAECAARTRSS